MLLPSAACTCQWPPWGQFGRSPQSPVTVSWKQHPLPCLLLVGFWTCPLSWVPCLPRWSPRLSLLGRLLLSLLTLNTIASQDSTLIPVYPPSSRKSRSRPCGCRESQSSCTAKTFPRMSDIAASHQRWAFPNSTSPPASSPCIESLRSTALHARRLGGFLDSPLFLPRTV